VRSRVEHVFGSQQNSMGGKLLRNLTYNLMRYLQLTKGREGTPAVA